MKNLKGILRGSSLIAGGTLITRILGFLREVLAAAFFGSGKLYDAFVIAFSVPNLFRRVLGEEMFERAFLPPFKRMVEEGKKEKARKFLIKTFLISFIVSISLLVIIYIFLPYIIKVLAPGMEHNTFLLTIELAKIIAPFMVLIAISTFFGAILLFSGKKVIYSTAPAFMNLTIIFFMILFHSKIGIKSMAFAYLLGAGAFIIYQVPALIKISRNLMESKTTKESARVGKSFWEGAKILISSLITKSTQIVDRIVASLIGSGAISSLWYSFRIINLPISVIPLSLSRTIAPELSETRGKNDMKKFSEMTNTGIDLILIILFPITLFFLFFSKEIIIIFYKRGAFGSIAVSETSLAFFYYTLSILPSGFVALFNRVYSALEDNKLPLYAAFWGGLINIVLDFILYRTSLKQGGIALATAIAIFVQSLILLVYLSKFKVKIEYKRFLLTSAKLIFASFFFVPILLIFKLFSNKIHGFLAMLFYLGFTFLVSFAVYGIIIYGFWRKRYSTKKRVILTGGGTGGHVYPSLSIYNILKKEDFVGDVLYIGIRGRAEEKILKKRKDIKLEFITSSPFSGNKVKVLIKIIKGTLQAGVKILKFKPHLIVATGGYVSAPVVFAGFLLKPFLKLKIVIEEQNFVPGLLNKVASLMADVVLVNYRETSYFIWSNRCVLCGYPLREDYYKEYNQSGMKKKLGIPEEKFFILITGGSLGSRSINRVVANSMKELMKNGKLYVYHSLGLAESEEYDSYKDTKAILKNELGKDFDDKNFEVKTKDGFYYKGTKYIHDIVNYQKAADLIISRAGAGAISEIAALRKPSVLVPKRGLPGDHQELNAINIVESKAAEIIFEKLDFETGIDYIDKKEFVKLVNSLLKNSEKLNSFSQNIGKFSIENSDKIIADTVKKLFNDEPLDFLIEIVEPRFVRFRRLFDSLIRYLDKTVQEKGKDNLYVKLYNIKIEEYMRSDNYLVVNKAIKLIGSLRREDLYPWIYENFSNFKGFLRRNSLIAFGKSEKYFDFFKEIIEKALNDSYYEVRREAISLYRKFYKNLEEDQNIKNKILEKLSKKSESFEVKAEAIRAGVLFLSEDEFFRFNRQYLSSRNIRIREALLESIECGLINKKFEDLSKVKNFIKQMLITTSEFKPEFRVREKYMKVVKILEGYKE